MTEATARVAAGAVVALDERAARLRRGELADGDIVHVVDVSPAAQCEIPTPPPTLRIRFIVPVAEPI